MPIVGLGLFVLLVLIGLGIAFVNTDVRTLVRSVRYVVGGLLLALGAAFAAGARWGIAIALVFLGLSAILRGRIGPFSFETASGGGGQASQVRSARLDMTLDHDTGALHGRVLVGRFAGRDLDDLDGEALRQLLAEVAADTDSVRLLQAYLDRREPGWRDNRQEDAASGARGTTGAGAMSEEEAYQILGLKPGVGRREIREAHRRLMKQFHPDRGGSTFLAAKINEAKELLLGKHR